MSLRSLSSLKTALQNWQYCSDLHIVKNGFPRIKPTAPNLIIAGDIACGGWNAKAEEFLRQISPHFDRIFFVPGNHDLFGHESISHARNLIKDTESKILNLTVLEAYKRPIKVDNCLIMGTTLWSHIPRKHWQHYINNYNDYRWIKKIDNDLLFDPNNQNLMHFNEKQYLQNCFSDEMDAGLIPIVVTHHAPLVDRTCHKMYFLENSRTEMLNHGYCTELFSLLEHMSRWNPIWVFGHTHYRTHFKYIPNADYPFRSVYLTTNALGMSCYIPKKVKTPLVPTATLDRIIS